MAAISTGCPKPQLQARDRFICSPLVRPRSFSLHSSIFGSKIPARLSRKTVRVSGSEPVGPTGLRTVVTAAQHSFDVVIIGAGIIGLTIARQLLIGSDLSVALVDRAVPCSGATGAGSGNVVVIKHVPVNLNSNSSDVFHLLLALEPNSGQGYLWMAHKTPGSDIWELARRSHLLWEMLANSIRNQGLDPLDVLGWMKTGSLLVGRTLEESIKLNSRVKQFSEAGLRAEFLPSSKLLLEEPTLFIEKEGGAAFFPDDSQLDAHRTVAFIEKSNRKYASQGRYAEFYHDPVISLSGIGSRGGVKAVRTTKNTIHSNKAVIIAAGCWSGTLINELFRESDALLDIPVKPRKGHLLVLENFDSLQLNHGLMEAGYVHHQNTASSGSGPASSVDDGQNLSISMTATRDTKGSLVLGSSREFVGFNTEVDETILNLIWQRAGEFFPKLREISLSTVSKSKKVRVGLRPYMPDGRPVIGPVLGSPNVYVAAGHEGGGLSLGLGTAEMVADMILGNPGKVDFAPFAVKG